MERVTKTHRYKKKLAILQQVKMRQKIVQEFKQIIKNKESDFVWLTYNQGQLFQKFKEKEWFVSLVSQFGVSKLTIIFKIALFKLTSNCLKIKARHYLFVILKSIWKRL